MAYPLDQGRLGFPPRFWSFCANWSRFGSDRGNLRRQVQIAPATVTKMNIVSVGKAPERSRADPQVAFAAYAIARDRYPFFSAREQAVKVPQNTLRNISSKFRDLFLDRRCLAQSLQLDLLQSDERFHYFYCCFHIVCGRTCWARRIQAAVRFRNMASLSHAWPLRPWCESQNSTR